MAVDSIVYSLRVGVWTGRRKEEEEGGGRRKLGELHLFFNVFQGRRVGWAGARATGGGGRINAFRALASPEVG